MRTINENQAPYHPKVLRAVGQHPVTVEVYAMCHNETAPCIPEGNREAKQGSVDITDRSSFHNKIPLKLRNPPRATLVSHPEKKKRGSD